MFNHDIINIHNIYINKLYTYMMVVGKLALVIYACMVAKQAIQQ